MEKQKRLGFNIAVGGKMQYPYAKIHAHIQQLIDSFGAERFLWGSDGPNVERSTGTGQYHGGVIASLIDIAGDFALIAVLGYGVPTINFRVDYLRPATNSDLLALARVRRAGRTIGVVDIDVTDTSGRLIALGRGCYGTQAG